MALGVERAVLWPRHSPGEPVRVHSAQLSPPPCCLMLPAPPTLQHCLPHLSPVEHYSALVAGASASSVLAPASYWPCCHSTWSLLWKSWGVKSWGCPSVLFLLPPGWPRRLAHLQPPPWLEPQAFDSLF